MLVLLDTQLFKIQTGMTSHYLQGVVGDKRVWRGGDYYLPCAVSDAVEMATLTGVNSLSNSPAIAQMVTVPSSSVTMVAFPLNWISGTSEISEGKQKSCLHSRILKQSLTGFHQYFATHSMKRLGIFIP